MARRRGGREEGDIIYLNYFPPVRHTCTAATSYSSPCQNVAKFVIVRKGKSSVCDDGIGLLGGIFSRVCKVPEDPVHVLYTIAAWYIYSNGSTRGIINASCSSYLV